MIKTLRIGNFTSKVLKISKEIFNFQKMNKFAAKFGEMSLITTDSQYLQHIGSEFLQNSLKIVIKFFSYERIECKFNLSQSILILDN